MKTNIVLTGFMGTGKTSTGRLLASRLGYAFLDLDVEIEKKFNKVKEFYEERIKLAQKGEAYFRACERQVVQEASKRQHAVISTGGGVVKNPDNIRDLRQNGLIVCLTADIDTILLRTGKRGERPVLDKEDQGNRRAAVEKVMQERAGLYADADVAIDTSHVTPLRATEQIIRIYKAKEE